MKLYGRTSISEFLGDFIVYRNLVPVDPRLPALSEIAKRMGIPKGVIPRKYEKAYGQVIVELLSSARSLIGSNKEIRRLIYLGDTKMNDTTAFLNICAAGNFEGMAFIGDENSAPPKIEEAQEGNCIVCSANRWSLLAEFDRLCRSRGFIADEQTAVISDIDKTILGARGRNDAVIDRVRVDAVERVINEKMTGRFNHNAFQTAYDTLKRSEYHVFTADNQDYLVYLCLAVGSGVTSLDSLTAKIKTGAVKSFQEFIFQVEKNVAALPADMRAIHNEVYEFVKAGDPTPFKTFRTNEFKLTVERMGHADDDMPVPELLQTEILLTEEVRDFILNRKLQGSIVFGLSDKPDEASLPTGDLAVRGFLPIHQIITHSVGQELGKE